MTLRALVRCLAPVCVGAALLVPAYAQSTARLAGVVTDPSGAAVESAVVSLYRPAMTEAAVTAVTTYAGLFEFDALPPEAYRVVVEKPGFAKYELTNIALSPGAEFTIAKIQLSIDTPRTVVGTSEVIRGSNTEVSTTLTADELADLPVLNRSPLGLLGTRPGVVSLPGAGTSTVINGLRTSFSNVTLDGINVQDNTVRSNALDFLPTNPRLSQIEQVTLVTSNQATIYGNGATQTAFVSPSGTNALHGSVFYLNSNNLLNAGAWFQNSARLSDAYKSHLGGFNVGGPLLRERLFGYAAYEAFRQRNTEGQRAFLPAFGDFSAQGLLNLVRGAGVTVDPAVSALFGLIPAANAGNGVYEHAESRQTDTDNATARLDFIPSQRNTIVLSYLYTRVNADSDRSLYASRAAVVQREKASLWSGSWRYSPTGRLTNEVRFGADITPVAFNNREQTGPYILNLGYLQSFNFNWINSSQNQGRRLQTYNIQDNASYLVGRHNFQFGFQAQLIKISSYIGDAVPTVYLGTPDGDNTAEQIAADLIAIASGRSFRETQRFYPVGKSGTLAGGPEQQHPSFDNYSFYFQDNGRITNNLRLTLGLRYEYFTPFSDSDGSLYQPSLINNSIDQTLSSPTVTYNLKSSGFYRPDKKNLAPSIGLVLDPSGTGKTVLRAAYGLSYVNDDFAETFRYTLSQNNFFVGLRDVFTNSSLSQFSALTPPPAGAAIPRSLPSGTTIALGLIDGGLRTPYVQQWSAGVQHEVAGYIFNLRYVGNHATKQLRQDVIGGGRLDYLSNSGGSRYNAFQFEVAHTRRRNLDFEANYTFSKVLTDANFGTSTALDPYRSSGNHHLDFGPAVFDIKHALKVNVIYDVPFGRSGSKPAYLRSLIGGWSVSGIAVVQSGAPFSILTNYLDANGALTQTASSNLSPADLGRVVSFHQTGAGPTIIDPAASPKAFFRSPAGSPGYLQPRSFYGPASFDMDLSIQKRFPVTEHQSLEIRSIAVNALNHPSFGFGNQLVFSDVNIVSPGFGRNSFALYPSRRVQLSLMYRF